MRVWDGSKNSLSWIQIHGYCVFPQKEIRIAVIIEELFGMGTIQASDVMAVLYGNCAPQGVQAADKKEKQGGKGAAYPVPPRIQHRSVLSSVCTEFSSCDGKCGGLHV